MVRKSGENWENYQQNRKKSKLSHSHYQDTATAPNVHTRF